LAVLKHQPKQIEFVEQRHKTDCGVACLAMLCGYMYEEMSSIISSLDKRKKGGMYPEDVLEILEVLGHYQLECKNLPKRGNALVAIQWKDPKLSGHYVVWNSKRKQFLDPIHGIVSKRDLLKIAFIENIWKISWRKK